MSEFINASMNCSLESVSLTSDGAFGYARLTKRRISCPNSDNVSVAL